MLENSTLRKQLRVVGASEPLERQINSHYYERLLSSKDKSLLITEAQKNADKMTVNLVSL